MHVTLPLVRPSLSIVDTVHAAAAMSWATTSTTPNESTVSVAASAVCRSFDTVPRRVSAGAYRRSVATRARVSGEGTMSSSSLSTRAHFS